MSDLRYQNLIDPLSRRLSNFPVSVSGDGANTVVIEAGETRICRIKAEDEFYRISTEFLEWKAAATSRWEDTGSGSIEYYVEMPDECIGEVEQLVIHVGTRKPTFKLESPRMIGRLTTREQWIEKLKPMN